MESGILWAVKTTRALALRSGASVSTCRFDVAGIDLDEFRVRVPASDVGHLKVGMSIASNRRAGLHDVLLVLPTAGVAVMGREGQRQHPSDPVLGHLPERVVEKRVPVPHADIDRQSGRREAVRGAPRPAAW